MMRINPLVESMQTGVAKEGQIGQAEFVVATDPAPVNMSCWDCFLYYLLCKYCDACCKSCDCDCRCDDEDDEDEDGC